MSYNEPKPGDVIAKWEMAEPYSCNGSITENQNGDNPNLSFDASLPNEGDTRIKGGTGANPIPGKVGA